jgi:hypothetical protein
MGRPLLPNCDANNQVLLILNSLTIVILVVSFVLQLTIGSDLSVFFLS